MQLVVSIGVSLDLLVAEVFMVVELAVTIEEANMGPDIGVAADVSVVTSIE